MGFHYHIPYIESIIIKNAYKKIAEVGVWRSEMVNKILSNNSNIKEYWGIDHWKVYRWKKVGEEDKKERYAKRLDEYYKYACKLMINYPSYRILRMSSVDAANVFPKEYFDLIFIDADHSYQSVVDDINVWLPLVKKGGKLTGHDYGGGQHKNVTKAVNRVLGKKNILSYYKGRVWCYNVI